MHFLGPEAWQAYWKSWTQFRTGNMPRNMKRVENEKHTL